MYQYSSVITYIVSVLIILFLKIENSGLHCPISVLNKYGQSYRSLVIGKLLKVFVNIIIIP